MILENKLGIAHSFPRDLLLSFSKLEQTEFVHA